MRKLLLSIIIAVYSYAGTFEENAKVCEEYDNIATYFLGEMVKHEKTGNFELLQKNGNVFLEMGQISVNACKKVGIDEYDNTANYKQHTIDFIRKYIADKYPTWDYTLKPRSRG